LNNDDYDGKKAEEINKLEQTILTQLKVCGSETDKESNGFFFLLLNFAYVSFYSLMG
jgi:hypothetical protein